MDNPTILAFFLIFASTFLSYYCVASSLCSQTPHPELCNSLIPNKFENIFSFQNMALKATLTHAQNVHNEILAMNISSFNELGKLAWFDCLELYKDSLYQINRSIDQILKVQNPQGSNPRSGSAVNYDVQTWLSASLANHETCMNGFHDFKLSLYLEKFPILFGDFSKYLSNSLAINKAITLPSKRPWLYQRRHLLSQLKDVFPGWVSLGDRKLLQTSSQEADIVVAQDGSGDYKTISEALGAAKSKSTGNGRYVIYVKRGVYKEIVEIKKTMKNLMFFGDGIGATVITGNNNVDDGFTTFRSATFAISGDGFIARDISFENTAGPQKHQAVALRSGSDFSVFYRCSFKGYQDTLYVYSHRQFYRDCDIYGTIDFILGDAVTVFQNCNIYIRKPMSDQRNSVTAQARSSPNENTGIIIHGCRVTAAPDLKPVQGSFKSYLGRPWKEYSRTLIIKSSIDGVIDPAGWLPWSGEFALKTLYYGEYMNIGGGAATGGRVKWPGYHVITSVTEVAKFSVGNFLAGNSWLPATRVPYTSSL